MNIISAHCPDHGTQNFQRSERCSWWECQQPGRRPTFCGWVIPDEMFTPDGGDVVRLEQGRWVTPNDRKGGKTK